MELILWAQDMDKWQAKVNMANEVGFHRIWGIFCLAKEQIASYGLCSTKLVIDLVI
jgi:hypothetical protein